MKVLISFFFFWASLIKLVKIDYVFSQAAPTEAVTTATTTFDAPENLLSLTRGVVGYSCDFTAAHTLEPSLHEHRSIICSINTHFIYDKVFLVVPTSTKNPDFKLKPAKCFEEVYTDLSKENTVKLTSLELVDPKPDNNKYEDKIVYHVELTPFNKYDVRFYCVCDNSAQKSGGVSGRSAFVEITVMKYPYHIHAINLMKESIAYLPHAIKKEDFKENVFTLEVDDGELVVLACPLVDNKCFQKSTKKALYKSHKIIFKKNMIIFKAPFYTSNNEVDATCTCKVDNVEHKVIVEPKKKTRSIHGCDFTKEPKESLFSSKLDISTLDDKSPKTCLVDLNTGMHNILIGMNCPGTVDPNCFFQVYEYNEEEPLDHTAKITYLDNQLGLSGFEFYEESEQGNVQKIFSLVGNVKKAKGFFCICKHGNKTGIMAVRVSSSYAFVLSNVLIFALTIFFTVL